jgi:hypothetical protein
LTPEIKPDNNLNSLLGVEELPDWRPETRLHKLQNRSHGGKMP